MPEDRSILSRPGPAPDAQQSYGPHPDQVIDWYPAAEPDAGPVVVVIHGGYWRPEYDREHARSAAAGLAAAGCTTALIEYRREPGHPDDMVDDVTSAIRHVADKAPEGSGVLVVGHSAGGHLALLAATQEGQPIEGVVALAPLSSLAEADRLDLDDGAVRSFLGRSAADRPDLDPSALPPPRVPVVLIHGQEDSLVPVEMSETFASHQGASLRLLPGTGHFELIDPLSAVWSGILTELQGIASAAGIE